MSYFGKNIFKPIVIAIQEAVKVFHDFFSSDTEIMSKDIKKIMANPEDRKRYLNAVKELKIENKKRTEVTFSNKEKMTLTLED